MAGMCDAEEPDGSKEIFEGRRSMQKNLGLSWNSRSLPGCLTRAPLVLLLTALGFFMLLVTTLVQVSRLQQSLQGEKSDPQGSQCLEDVSQKQRQSGFEDILQQLTWMNATLAGLCRPCSWNWEFFQGNCYFFSQTKDAWKASVAACQGMKAQLVIVNTTEEQKFLTVWNARKNQRIWIGLSDHHSEGAWKWVDDTPLLLSFWQEGEPNNHDNEDCGELSGNGWNDNKCSTENFWTCEKPSTPCPGL
ncbi:CD209 antigen isoform X1 [Manis pentadactyla]|uniref:CD209 antigen isoform X1 n=1 Tax=Manis pentadactyla TaxID=143292 RepID=UPI0018774810|nr:CD209 antigen isoform X1 [Manis pentadactyla]KAI5227037.1 hypothetical protein MUG91_G238n63 [Manis pentadactyla]